MPNGRRKKVILGPLNELHAGIHQSMFDDPPRGFFYEKKSGVHIFPLPMGTKLFWPLSPHRYYHWGEFVDFGSGSEIVHSSRYPVVNRKSWVVCMDDFGYPVVAGRYIWNPKYWKFRRDGAPNDFREHLRKRVKSMLTAYTHPSCKAIFFITKTALNDAEDWLKTLGLSAEGVAFIRKCRILYPAQRASELDVVQKKWGRFKPFHVLFCGNDFEVKNGLMALRIFSRLAKTTSRVHFTYIGFLPKKHQTSYGNLLRDIEYYPPMPRRQLLRYFQRSHILFHPSKNESFGMVYLEAAASGQAIVTASGRGVRHVEEILDPRGALLVDRDSIHAGSEEAAFESLLRELTENEERAASMGRVNYHLITHGRYSLQNRNSVLSHFYQKCLEKPAKESFSLKTLPDWERTVPFAMRCEEINADITAYKMEIGFKGLNLYV